MSTYIYIYKRFKTFIANKLSGQISLNSDATKLMELRSKIINSKGIKKQIQIRNYKKILKRNISFIPLVSNIGNDIQFPHGIAGVFISQGANIGNKCVIFHGVTIGSNTIKDSKNYGAPTISDGVYIGAGATIIGGVTIGRNARIGANTTITFDVPENSTVVSQQPRIIVHNEELNNTFNQY